MARANFVRKAQKDNPAVKAGESYYWWKFRFGGKHYSATQPRSSQLTQSAYYSAIRSLGEQCEDASCVDGDDIESIASDATSELETIRDECEESRSNMPDTLQDSPTGELLQERIDACEEAISEIENIDGEFEYDEDEPEEDDFTDDEDELDDDAYNEAHTKWEGDKAAACAEWADERRSEITDAISNCEV